MGMEGKAPVRASLNTTKQRLTANPACRKCPCLILFDDAAVPPFLTRHLHKSWSLQSWGMRLRCATRASATCVKDNMSNEE